MDVRAAESIETVADFASAAILAAAAGFAVGQFTGSAASPAAAAGAAFFLSLGTLRSFGADPGGFALTPFVPAGFPEPEVGELLLTDADRLDAARAPAGTAELVLDDVLMLDDVLAELGDDSRVVRLFDASAMPTPGQLKARIDRHLVRTDPQAASSDASGALHEALAELRRSLR